MKFTDIKQKIAMEILKYLEKSVVPVPESELCDAFSITPPALRNCIQYLIDRGYDIKEISQKNRNEYQLVRTIKLDEEQFYRIHGQVKTPLLLTADWHIGSYQFSEQAYFKLVEDVENFGVKSIIHAGDLLQGRGVHKLELTDLRYASIDEQINIASQYIDLLPNHVKLHVCLGNHEAKLKGSTAVGLDVLQRLSKQNSKIRYYGHVFKLEVNHKYSLLTMHSSGGTTYATSYRPERIFKDLTERPDILVMGHIHKLMVLSHPLNKLIIIAGTLQRENAYLLWKGISTQVGWCVLTEYNDELSEYVFRYPRVY